MDEGRLNVQDELAGIALDIMRSFRSLDQNDMDGQAIGKLAAVVEKLFLQASNMASELDENRERISELCQQVEEYLERNGDLRDELRSLKDNHEKVVLSMENEHDKEMEVQKARAKSLEAANNSLCARNQQLVLDIVELQDSNQRYEHLAPRYESQVAELQKNLEGLQKALMKSDQLVEEAKSSVGNPPVVKSSKVFSHASVQTEFPSTASNIQDMQDKVKDKASKLVWLSEMKEGLSNAITHLDFNMKKEPETDLNESDLSLADELQQADGGRKMKDSAFFQEAFPAKDFKTYFDIRDQPIQQNRSEFSELKRIPGMSEHNLPSTSTSPQPTSTSLINFPSSSTAPQVDLTRTDNADNKRTLEDAFSDEEASSAKSALRNATTLNSSEILEDQPQNSDDKASLIADEKPAEEESLAKEESTEGSNHSSVEVDAPIIVLSATAGQEVRSDDDTGNVSVVLMTVEAFTTYHHASPDDVPTLPVSDEEHSVKPVMEPVQSGEEEKPVEQTTPTVEFPPEQEEQPAEVAEVAEVARTVDLEAGNGDGGVVENGETGVDEALEGPQGDHQEGPIVTEPGVDEIEATEPAIQRIEITTVTLAPGELTLDGKDVELSALKTAFPTPFIRLVQQHPKLAHMVENPAHGYRHIHGHGHGRGEELAEVPSTGSGMSGVSDAPTATTVDESGSAESLVKSDHEDQQNGELSDDVVNMKALAELIDSSTRNCSYSQGYVKRQLVYACRTCILDVMDPAGMCLACALNCHEDHDIVPMLTRRNFRCDCGNSKFGPRKCQLIPDKDRENPMNVYNDNFHGVVCTCKKSLAGTTASTGNLTEVASGTAANAGADEDIVQCRICEEQYHASHIGVTEEDFGEEWEGEMVCRNCLNEHDFLRYYQADLNNPEAFIPEAGQICTLAALKRKFGEQQSAGRSYVFSGSWWENLCRCSDCQDMYRKQDVDFLLDPEDTFASYEEREGTKEMENVQRAAAMSPEEIFAQICEGFDSITQVELAHWFNNLREVFVTFLQTKLSQGQQTITDADIEEFFATFSNMQEDREEDDCDLI